jgi:hypothetical protein
MTREQQTRHAMKSLGPKSLDSGAASACAILLRVSTCALLVIIGRVTKKITFAVERSVCPSFWDAYQRSRKDQWAVLVTS